MEPAREIPGCITSGCALSVYGINFHPIMMCPLRRSVPVMIIPTHIVFARWMSYRMIPAIRAGRGGYDG